MRANPVQLHEGIPASAAPSGHPDHVPALRAALAQQLGELRYGLWFGDEVHLDLSGDGGLLQVQVPNAFFREWIKNHFSSSLVEAAQAVTGQSVRVNITIQSEIDPPLGNVVEAETDPSRESSGHPVTVPIPGNPKAPLSSPAAQPAGPENAPVPRFQPPATDHIPVQNHSRSTAANNAAQPRLFASPAILRSLRRLDEFMTGPGNQLAHAAAREMIQTAGKTFNPLLIHGEPLAWARRTCWRRSLKVCGKFTPA